ncbi:hypothetical protein BS47DRAFT_1289453, partial [Hydnum rufescens UP504]
IRKLTVVIVASMTILLPLWQKLCQKLIKTLGMLARDVRTRWNSTNDMLASVLEYHAVVEAMTQSHENGLCDFELLDEDWDIITQLKEVFKQATLLFSVKDTANLANVIPVMDSIDSVLEVGMGTKKYHDSIHLGLALARQMLNHYYSKTDASDAYRVAMCRFFLPALSFMYKLI